MNKIKVIIFGATGSLGKYIVKALMQIDNVDLTLFVRNIEKLPREAIDRCNIIKGDATNYADVKDAVTGHDIVYTGMSGDLDGMSEILIKAMKATVVNHIIAISSMGIYGASWKATLTDPKHSPGFMNSLAMTFMRSMFAPYRRLADRIETSGLTYTILRPGRFTEDGNINYRLTYKGQSEAGRDISRKSIADFVAHVVAEPKKYENQNIGLTKK